jgi:hypothetical protein
MTCSPTLEGLPFELQTQILESLLPELKAGEYFNRKALDALTNTCTTLRSVSIPILQRRLVHCEREVIHCCTRYDQKTLCWKGSTVVIAAKFLCYTMVWRIEEKELVKILKRLEYVSYGTRGLLRENGTDMTSGCGCEV